MSLCKRLELFVVYSHGQTGDGTSHVAVCSWFALTDLSAQGDTFLVTVGSLAKPITGFGAGMCLLSSQG